MEILPGGQRLGFESRCVPQIESQSVAAPLRGQCYADMSIVDKSWRPGEAYDPTVKGGCGRAPREGAVGQNRIKAEDLEHAMDEEDVRPSSSLGCCAGPQDGHPACGKSAA